MGSIMKWAYNDGGRASAGRRGDARDCVCRAVAITTGLPYAEIYAEITALAKSERVKRGKRSSPRTGVNMRTVRRYLDGIGWRWTATMGIGTGCKVHLCADELPPGRLIVSVSRHVVAVIDGVIHDTHDPSRNGARCVYGYWRPRPQ